MPSKLLDKPLAHLAAIIILGLLAYSNTFDVPFQFDDHLPVLENPAIRTLSGIPAMLVGATGNWASRPLLQATLALNYHFGGVNTAGYHAVNLAFHILNGILLYLLVVMTGKHLKYGESDIRRVALLSSLLFLVHPAQTEAVTYIVSRTVLFATTFCLLGLILFLKAVTSETKRGLYVACLFIVSVLGMASREDFAIFPLMLLFYDLFFVSRFRLKEAAGHYGAHIPVLLSLAYMAHLVANNTYNSSADYSMMYVPNLDYALTQFKVHWTYLRLLVLPLNQNLDYDYPISKTLFELPTIISLIGYAALWGFGIVFAKRRPMAAFSVLWFLVALLPISFGVAMMKDLKLNDVLFEHRLYLPSLAFFPLAAAGILRLSEKLKASRRSALAVSISPILVIVLISATFARNEVWQSEISLWQDVVRKSPIKARGHHNLGHAYDQSGFSETAINEFKIALKLAPDSAAVHSNLGNAYGARGQFDLAVEQLQIAVLLNPDLADAYYDLGIVYLDMGQAYMARIYFEQALEINPNHYWARQFLGQIATT